MMWTLVHTTLAHRIGLVQDQAAWIVRCELIDIVGGARELDT